MHQMAHKQVDPKLCNHYGNIIIPIDILLYTAIIINMQYEFNGTNTIIVTLNYSIILLYSID